MREYTRKNKERINDQRKARYAANPEPAKARSSRYRSENPDKTKEVNAKSGAKWRSKNLASGAAKTARYRYAKMKRTPFWLSEDQHWIIEEIYDLCALRTQLTGILHHVDHIIPIQGETVSGLHVPWNLQVIPAKVNWSKNNRHITN